MAGPVEIDWSRKPGQGQQPQDGSSSSHKKPKPPGASPKLLLLLLVVAIGGGTVLYVRGDLTRWFGAVGEAASSDGDSAITGEDGQVIRNPDALPAGWYTDSTAALSEVKRTGKPVLMAFHGNSPYCRKMKGSYHAPVVNKAISRFVPLLVDVNNKKKTRKLVHNYNISNVPSYRVVKLDGTILLSMQGAREEEEFARILNNIRY